MGKKFNPSSAADRFAKLRQEVNEIQKKAERTEIIPISSIIINSDNVFSENDTEEEIKNLAENIRDNGLIHNILVAELSPDKYLLISGERRTRAMKYLGRNTIKATIKSGLSELEIMKLLFFANSETREYSTEEKIHIISRFSQKLSELKNSDKTAVKAFNSYVSEAFNINSRQASKLISISSELSEPLKNMLFSDIIDINAAAAFAQLPENYQSYAVNLISDETMKAKKDSILSALEFTKLSKNIISKSNISLSKNKTAAAYYNKRLESAKADLSIMEEKHHSDYLNSEQLKAIETQIDDINVSIHKYETILNRLNSERENMIQLRNKNVEKVFSEISSEPKISSNTAPQDNGQLISKEVKKIEDAVKKLMKLEPSDKLDQINELIKKYLKDHNAE